MSHAVFGNDLDLVPVLRFVSLQFFIRIGNEVVAALELRFADKNTPVGIDAGAEAPPGEIFTIEEALEASPRRGRRWKQDRTVQPANFVYSCARAYIT